MRKSSCVKIDKETLSKVEHFVISFSSYMAVLTAVCSTIFHRNLKTEIITIGGNSSHQD